MNSLLREEKTVPIQFRQQGMSRLAGEVQRAVCRRRYSASESSISGFGVSLVVSSFSVYQTRMS